MLGGLGGGEAVTVSAVANSRLAKAAVDNGFDREFSPEGDWLAFASTHCPLRIWLRAASTGSLAATFSQQNVIAALGEIGAPFVGALPKGAQGGRVVSDIPAVHRLLRRAFQLGRSLPDELLQI